MRLAGRAGYANGGGRRSTRLRQLIGGRQCSSKASHRLPLAEPSLQLPQTRGAQWERAGCFRSSASKRCAPLQLCSDKTLLANLELEAGDRKRGLGASLGGGGGSGSGSVRGLKRADSPPKGDSKPIGLAGAKNWLSLAARSYRAGQPLPVWPAKLGRQWRASPCSSSAAPDAGRQSRLQTH